MGTLVLSEAGVLDQEVLVSIYEQHSPALFRYAVRLLGDPDLAEDCVAETFSRLLRALRSGGGPPRNLQAYLYRMARNWIIDQFRRQPPDLPLDGQPVGDRMANTSHLVGERIERERVRRALLRLTPDQREVIVLRFLEGWRHEQVAAWLGKSVEATRGLQTRGLVALRHMLVEPEDSQ